MKFVIDNYTYNQTFLKKEEKKNKTTTTTIIETKVQS